MLFIIALSLAVAVMIIVTFLDGYFSTKKYDPGEFILKAIFRIGNAGARFGNYTNRLKKAKGFENSDKGNQERD